MTRLDKNLLQYYVPTVYIYVSLHSNSSHLIMVRSTYNYVGLVYGEMCDKKSSPSPSASVTQGHALRF